MEVVMVIPEDKVRITITIDRDTYEQIKKLSDILDLKPAKIATNLMYMGLDDANILKKAGLLHIAKKLRFFKKYVAEAGEELAAE